MSLISSYFSPQEKKTKPVASTSKNPIVLDDSDDSAHAPVKRKASDASQALDKRPEKRTKVSSVSSTSQSFIKWKYNENDASSSSSAALPIAGPSSRPLDDDDDLSLPSVNGSPPKAVVDKAKAKRHDAFVRKVLGSRSSNSFGYLDKESIYAPVEEDGSTMQAKKVTSVPLDTSKGKGKAKDKYTPLEEQWLDIKRQNPDTVIIMEVGYKFKFFGDDAVTASKELNIAHYMDKHFMSAMVPTQRLHVHIKRLLQAGHKVGVVRQTETAALKKVSDNRNAPFERKLSELYTLSTYVDELDADEALVAGEGVQAGTILCLVESNVAGKGTDEMVELGTVAVQPSTGDVVYDHFTDGFMRNELETRLLHLRPGEVLLTKDISKLTRQMIKHCSASGDSNGRMRLETVDKLPKYDKALSRLMNLFTEGEDVVEKETSTSLDQLSDLPKPVVVSLSLLMKHLKKFSLTGAIRQNNFHHFSNAVSVTLNGNTLSNLDIFKNSTDYTVKGSLFWLLDECCTIFGRRQLNRWIGRPLTRLDALNARLDCVEEIIESTDYRLGKLRGLLGGLPDLERGLARIHYGRATPQELIRILQAFQRIAGDFKESELNGFKSPLLNNAISAFPCIKKVIDDFLVNLDLKAAREGNKENLFKPEVYGVIDDAKDSVAFVDVELQEELKKLRKSLKKPSLQYVSIAQEEYLIEVRISESSKLPDDWTRINSTKHVHRYRPPDVQRLMEERERAIETLAGVAESSYKNFLKRIAEHSESLRQVITHMANVDCLLSLAKVSNRAGYCKPKFVDHSHLDIKQGRHPMAEVLSDDPYVPNDVKFGQGQDGLRTMILTGSNAGGKSSLARMIALLAIMAQIGSYVPADEMTLGVFDGIYTRMGAHDDLAKGRSTFMVEMSETSEILKMATERSLIILDELGRGTATFDGVSIACATLEHIATHIRPMTIFITHFSSLMHERDLPSCRPFHMSYLEQASVNGIANLVFLYRLSEGATFCSHGLNVARLAGVPDQINEKAAAKAKQFEEEITQRQLANAVQKLLKGTLSDISLSGNIVGEVDKVALLLDSYPIAD